MTSPPPRPTRRSGYHSRGNVKVIHDPDDLFHAGASFNTLDIAGMSYFLALGFIIDWPERGRCVRHHIGFVDGNGYYLNVNNGNHNWRKLPGEEIQ